MKKSAKHNRSFWLLLKQGFRGLFKFKVQFSIILILSFLATLILTISVGTTRHLQSNYNRIVKAVPRFAYSGTTQIDKTAIENKGAPLAQYQPIPIVDFVNNAPVSVLTLKQPSKEIHEDEPIEIMDAQSNYNFILNDELYKDQLGNSATTFITKFMKNDFYKLTDQALKERGTLDDQYILEVSRILGWQLILDIYNYQETVKNKSLINNNSPIDLGDLSYLQTTAIAFLTVNNPFFFNFLEKWQNLNPNGKSGNLEEQAFNQLNYQERQFIDYVYWNATLFGRWLVNEFNRYVQVKSESIPPDAETLSNYFLGDKGETTGYYLKVAKNVSHDSLNDNRYLIVTDKAGTTDQNAINQAIVEKGFKGTTSPLIIELDEENKINNAIFTNFYQTLSLSDFESTGVPFNKELNWGQNFNTTWNPALNDGEWRVWKDSAKATAYQYHLQLTAMASGYDINFRKESLFFDMISSHKFRYVIQNGFDKSNFTILEGTAPSATGEVAISQQFARSNKIKIGDYLPIGQTDVMVVGYGTDPYSFMPIVDPTVPIPEPKTGAFIYGSAKTYKQISDGFGGTSSNQDLTPNYFNFFLTDRQNTWTRSADKIKLFNNLQMDLSANLGYNLANLEVLRPIYYEKNVNYLEVPNDGSQLIIPPKDVNYFWKLDDFNNSPYHLGWTIMPTAVRSLEIVAYVASLIIAIIALIALVICINKTIIATSRQMGILKSMGMNPWKISVVYLAYGFVIMFIVVPIAWLIGLALEIPFIQLFGTYFSIELLSINSSWPAFLIAFLGFGILAIVVSLVSAYLILRRPVLEIFDISIKWSSSRFFDFLKDKSFRGKSFNVRFSLTLASAGVKPILLLTTVIFLTSLLISGSLTIPAIANRAINSYYKNVRYANAYNNMTPTINSPLSKPALNYWEGNQVWDRDWVPNALKLDSTNNKYGYYQNPKGYTDSVSQNSVIPRYLYDPNPDNPDNPDNPAKVTTTSKLNYSYVFIAEYRNEFLHYVSDIFGNNFFTVLGEGFSIGVVDQFLGLILNCDEESLIAIMNRSPNEDEHYNKDISLDANKQNYCIRFMDSLATGLPKIIDQVIGGINGSVAPSDPSNDDNWKDQVVNAILTQVPPYIRSYIYKSPSRMEQFGIYFNTESYTPKKDSVFTQVKANSSRYQELPIVGLDQNQSAFALPKKLQNMITLEPQIINKIKEIFDGNYEVEDLFLGNFRIWNQQTRELTIPFIDNKQARSKYQFDKLPILNNIEAFGRQIKYHTSSGDSWEVLPKKAWIYDDSDFVKSNLFKDPSTTFNTNLDNVAYQNSYTKNQAYLSSDNAQNSFLDLYALDNNKFTYENLYDENQNLNSAAYMFNDFAVDDNLKLDSSYVRPYYSYKNIQLYLPMNKINVGDILTSMAKDNQGVGVDGSTDHPWYEIMEATNVPSMVKNAWNETNSQYLMIRPYDISYVNNPPKGIERITNGDKAKYWLRFAYDQDLGPGALSYENNELIKYGKYNQSSAMKINLQNVGTLDSYDSGLIIIDSLFANLLNNFSTARAYGYQNSFFDDETSENKMVSDSENEQPWPDKLAVYPLRDPTKDIYVSKDDLNKITYLNNYNDANNFAPLRWNTGKYSNIDEPESLTSSVSFNVIDNLGQYSLGLLYPSGLGMTTLIKDQTLLSTQRALINQIFTLSISLAVLLIIAIVITGSLLIMLMGDIYIAQYQNFMILMRALGYANWEIQTYAFSVVSILGFIAWVVATIVAWAIVFGIIRTISNRGIAMPYGLSWWPIVVSLLIIVLSFLGSLWVSSYKVRHDPVSILMSEG